MYIHKFEKKDFYIVGLELETFGIMVDGTHYETLDEAKRMSQTEKRCGIYHITIDRNGYWINGEWVS